jgi:hypothetical protein
MVLTLAGTVVSYFAMHLFVMPAYILGLTFPTSPGAFSGPLIKFTAFS